MKNLRNIIALLVFSLFSFSSFAQSVTGEWIVGKEHNTVIKIEKEEAVYSGKIFSSDNSKVKIGKLMVKDLKQTKGKWKGKVYSPKRKEWYDGEFTPYKDKLKVKIKAGFFSKTLEWKRK